MALKQDNRLVAIKTALGPDALGVRSIAVQEQISRLFFIEAELSSEDDGVNLDQVIGNPATIRLFVGQSQERYFNGYVSRLVQVANVGGYAHYRATIVPWLWFLTRTSDCRAWVSVEDPSQGKTVPEMIEAVFQARGFSDYRLSLSGNYPKREFCVQYRETDFNFVSRLMEQEGIYYYFEHEDGKHTLVLADSISAHKPFPGYADVTFNEADRGAQDAEVVTDWTIEKEVQPVATALQDFDFKKPKTSLLTSTNVTRKYGKAQFEIYDYPGEYLEHGDGVQLADVRLDELQTQYETLQGEASARGLAAGCSFNLKQHARADQNREYLITGVTLHADAGEFSSTPGAGGTRLFSCSFTAIDKKQQFRPARLTPKPLVQGPQTAIVVGPGGEEIYTDAYARVKVHFHWDRHDQSDQNSSCWVRVSQNWAGKTWGAIHIPRMGQEVVVEFLEGDPDRPIITGRIYNADQTPPYALPGNKTQSGVKSRSSKGGGSANFNEIRFEDMKGSEQVYIHAEKNQDNVVENDETTQVGHDRTENVGHDEKITVVNNRTESVGVNEVITIGSNRTEQVGANESITVGSNRTRMVGANETVTVALMRAHTVGVNEAITVGANQAITVGVNQATTVGVDQANTIGANQANTVGANQTNNIGANETSNIGANQSNTIGADQTNSISNNQTDSVGADRTTSITGNDTMKVGKVLAVEAGDEIVFKTGDASINMKKDGTIEIKGKDISIIGSGDITVKSDKDITMKGNNIKQN
jgi:type VI secretion system secreted protein VgrG